MYWYRQACCRDRPCKNGKHIISGQIIFNQLSALHFQINSSLPLLSPYRRKELDPHERPLAQVVARKQISGRKRVFDGLPG